ncbi:hypothetical protein ILP97_02615 [Amycolatopsis sp. H6(2020)]|nr:hypothetical protein [Amycolatopsis sp. H6(2020)]
MLAAAVANVELYEGRGWDEAKILGRVSEMDRIAGALARAVVEPDRFRRNHIQ